MCYFTSPISHLSPKWDGITTFVSPISTTDIVLIIHDLITLAILSEKYRLFNPHYVSFAINM
jgi:hypothetical protein